MQFYILKVSYQNDPVTYFDVTTVRYPKCLPDEYASEDEAWRAVNKIREHIAISMISHISCDLDHHKARVPHDVVDWMEYNKLV